MKLAPRVPVLVAGLLAALVYWLTRQSWLFGDGPYLVTVLARAREAGALPVWRHVLYLPLSDLVLGSPLARTPDEACRLVSALSGGVLVAATYALCRRSATRGAALSATLLMAATAPCRACTSTVVAKNHAAGDAAMSSVAESAAPRVAERRHRA